MKPEDQATRLERCREKRRRRGAKRNVKQAAEQFTAANKEHVLVNLSHPTDVCPSPTPSPAAQLQAELVSNVLREEGEAAVARGHICSCGLPNRSSPPTELSSTGEAISAALLKLNSGPVTSPRCASTTTKSPKSEPVTLAIRTSYMASAKSMETPLSVSDLIQPTTSSAKKARKSRARFTAEERERRRINRRFVKEHGYDMSDNDLDDLFPSRRRRREQDFDDSDDLIFDDGSSNFYSGGSEKSEYTLSFINGCKL